MEAPKAYEVFHHGQDNRVVLPYRRLLPVIRSATRTAYAERRQRRNRPSSMSLSAMTTIVVLFHTMRGQQFKAFYRGTVCRFMPSEFHRQLFLHPLCGPDAALCCSAGGLIQHVQGHLHCRLNATSRFPQLGASNATAFPKALPNAANHPPAGFTVSSCTRLLTMKASC